MRRDVVITVLLVIVGILLALALFGAGAVWKSEMEPSRPCVSAPTAERDRSVTPEKANPEEIIPNGENVASTPCASAVVIDGHVLSPQQL